MNKLFGRKSISEIVSETRQKLNKTFHVATQQESFLKDVYGHDKLKTIVWNTSQASMLSKNPINKLLIGDPGTGKSTILKELEGDLPKAKFILGTRSTKAGITDVFFDNPDIRFLLIDELDKMDKKDQAVLLSAMTTGEIKEVMRTRKREIKVNVSVIAAANGEKGIIEPLLDRFQPIIYMPKITKAEYVFIGMKLLTEKEGFSAEEAQLIIDTVWEAFTTNKSMRTLVAVARSLNKNIENLPETIETMLQYGKREDQDD